MRLVSVLGALLSVLVLAAHFFRAGRPALALASLAGAMLLSVRRAWAARALQVFLLVGAAEWLRTAAVLVEQRRRAGAPFLRLAVILGVVAAFTATSAALVGTRGFRGRPRTTIAGKNDPD